ncbi:MAG: hypothetical protein ACOCXP_02025, partial [Candidatus Dojkabacteria bacterium]
KRLRQIVRWCEVSDADMEKGQMRYELNISLQAKGEKELPDYKVEVKNIGSISLLQKVIETEAERQYGLLCKGEKPRQETRGTRDMSGKTFSQRVKEEADDYRYFPEPDIPPIELSDDLLEQLRAEIPPLPEELMSSFEEMGVSREHGETILGSKSKREYLLGFEEKGAEVAKLLLGGLEPGADKDLILSLIKKREEGEINSNALDQLLGEINSGVIKSKKELEKYIADKELTQTSEAGELEAMVLEEVGKDPSAKERFMSNPGVAMFFVGQIMKRTKGSANPQVVKDLVEAALKDESR